MMGWISPEALFIHNGIVHIVSGLKTFVETGEPLMPVGAGAAAG